MITNFRFGTTEKSLAIRRGWNDSRAFSKERLRN
jgi:hypothetical protein